MKTYNNLFGAAMLAEDSYKATCSVFESKLHCSVFQGDAETYIDYIKFLRHQSKHIEAKQVQKRALEHANDK